jgi:hypothetical protein
MTPSGCVVTSRANQPDLGVRLRRIVYLFDPRFQGVTAIKNSAQMPNSRGAPQHDLCARRLVRA